MAGFISGYYKVFSDSIYCHKGRWTHIWNKCTGYARMKKEVAKKSP
jgi:hypothetical protein